MKKLKHVKLFENFNNIDPKLKKTLMLICSMYKNEVLGSTEHPCEYWGDGEPLRELASKTDDTTIKSILDRMADYSQYDDEGDMENIFDYLQDADCDYIAEFLGLTPLSYEEDWTDEEEDTWSGSVLDKNETQENSLSSNNDDTITLTKSELKKFIQDCFDRSYGGKWSDSSKRIASFLNLK
jgi:hypothetical protein